MKKPIYLLKIRARRSTGKTETSPFPETLFVVAYCGYDGYRSTQAKLKYGQDRPY
jgi:hypothetical protein